VGKSTEKVAIVTCNVFKLHCAYVSNRKSV